MYESDELNVQLSLQTWITEMGTQIVDVGRMYKLVVNTSNGQSVAVNCGLPLPSV